MEITGSSDAGSLDEYFPEGHLCAGRGNENLCPKDELALSVAGSKRSRKDGRLNLRKSIAWDPAFFTEEGVLDPSELSMIAGSVNKASSKLPSKSNAERQPMKRFDKISKRPPLNNLEQNLSSKVQARLEARSSNKNDAKLLPISEIPIHGGPQMSMALRKTLSMKEISKNVPKLDAAYLRLEKAKTAKPHIENERSILKLNSCSSSSTSLQMEMTCSGPNVMMSSFRREEYNFHGLPPAPIQAKQSALRRVPSAHGRLEKANTVKPLIEKDRSLLELSSHPSSTNKSQMETACSDFDEIVSSSSQQTHTVCGSPSAPTHAKPSALRMPSPSLGFFEQKKSTSRSNQLRKTLQASICKIPFLRRPTNLKHMAPSKPPVAQTVQQAKKEFAACTGNMKVKHIDIKDNIYPMVCGSSNCQSDVAKEIKANCLSAGHKMDEKTQEILLGKLYTGRTDGLPEENCSKSQIRMKSYTEGSEEIGQVLIPKGSEKGCSSHQYSVSSVASEICSTLSEMHCPGELDQVNSKPLYACTINMKNDLVVHKGTEDKPDENDADTSKEMHSSKSSGLVSNLRPPSICIAFLATKEIGYHNELKEEPSKVGGADNGVQNFHGMRPQVQEAILGNTVTGEVTVSFTEDVQIVASDEGQTQGDFQLCELRNEKNEACFIEEKGLVVPVNKISMDNLKQDAVLFKHQLDVVPYSEEWLSAIEAYGEDILEVKTGNVQNSPPDKALPEPGPWSPVKRRDHDVGPFDCTKYTTKSAPSME